MLKKSTMHNLMRVGWFGCFGCFQWSFEC